MSEVRWQRGAAPPLIGLGLVLGMLWAPTDAAAATGAAAPIVAPETGCAAPGTGQPGGWYRRTARVDAKGWFRGSTLWAGRPDGTRTLRVRLPAESFVAPPVRGLLVYGADDGSRSEVRIVRLADGCDARLHTSADVVRRAALDPSGGTAYLHLVDRRSRADRGIWRLSVHWADGLTRVLPGLGDPADGPFGRTFLTLLTWSSSGRTLAVQSCGEVQCRTRLLDTTSGAWTLDERHGQGELLGLTDTERYGYEACHGLPCPIVATPRGGTPRTVVDAAGVATYSGGRIWYERWDRDGTISLRYADPGGRHDHAVRGPGGRLAWPARWADAAVEASEDSIAVTADGTWTDPRDVRLGRLGTGDTLRLRALEEATR